MKTNSYQPRLYRLLYSSKFFKQEVTVKESDLFISSDVQIERGHIKSLIIKYRKQIEAYIEKNKDFLVSLKPLKLDKNACSIIQQMLYYSNLAGVGPMAAVAGAIAEFVGNELLKECNEVIIENGGDIFLKTKRDIKVGVYAGDSVFSNKIFIKIKKQQTPLGICTSSGTVGHSLSFGNADAVVILSSSAIFSDAVATATANLVKTNKDFKKAINFVKNIKGINGVLIIYKDNLGVWGDFEISC